MNIVILLGAPGSGKGTVAGKLAAENANLKHVSSGDLLRGAVAKGTEAGRQAKACMEAGKLVPDALIATMIKDVVAETTGDVTMLLDGFPRNLAQAEILAEMGAPVKSAVLIDVPDDIALELQDIEDEQAELSDGLDAVSDDLEDVEDVVFEDYDEDDDEYEEDELDEECYATTCPTCEETIYFDESILEDGEVVCPNCGEKLEFDLTSLDEEPEDGEE